MPDRFQRCTDKCFYGYLHGCRAQVSVRLIWNNSSLIPSRTIDAQGAGRKIRELGNQPGKRRQTTGGGVGASKARQLGTAVCYLVFNSCSFPLSVSRDR